MFSFRHRGSSLVWACCKEDVQIHIQQQQMDAYAVAWFWNLKDFWGDEVQANNWDKICMYISWFLSLSLFSLLQQGSLVSNVWRLVCSLVHEDQIWGEKNYLKILGNAWYFPKSISPPQLMDKYVFVDKLYATLFCVNSHVHFIDLDFLNRKEQVLTPQTTFYAVLK